MNHFKKKLSHKFIATIVCAIVILCTLTGCAQAKDIFGKAKGDLIGQDFTITEYDHYGNKTLTMHGDSVSIGLLENDANISSESTGFSSEVLDITIDKHAIYEVGNTVIFAEKGLDMITDYELPADIDASDNSTSFILMDRLVNSVANDIGKSKVIIVSSQMGIPIGVYQGDSVYVTVPDDLPKTTRLNIDGKSLYINRANYTIIDAALIK